MTDDRYDRISWHDGGKTVDKLTAAALTECERRLGYSLTVVQGSYNTGVGASAGTHDGGGVVDLLAWDHDKKVRVLREVGFAAWHRPTLPGVWNEHIHAVLIGNEKMSSAARAQVTDYYNHRDGLAGHNYDGTWHPDPIPVFQYDPKPPKPPTPKADFTTAHASGLWDNPAPMWSKLVAACKDEDARLITLTETTRDGIWRDVTPTGWAFDRNDDKPGQSECSVMWSKQAWEDLGPAYSSQLAVTQFRTGTGHLRPPVTAITKPLGHKKTGLEVLVTTLHAPSDVQGPNGLQGTAPRLAAYREAVDSVHESWAIGREKHPNAARLLCADWNLDYRAAWVREMWEQEYPLLTPCWEGRIPERGTHGQRVIDWQAGSEQLTCVGAKVLPTVDGFDHRPLVAKWAVK